MLWKLENFHKLEHKFSVGKILLHLLHNRREQQHPIEYLEEVIAK
jgi:hypothetical protein